jgi:hypothetical protein
MTTGSPTTTRPGHERELLEVTDPLAPRRAPGSERAMLVTTGVSRAGKAWPRLSSTRASYRLGARIRTVKKRPQAASRTDSSARDQASCPGRLTAVRIGGTFYCSCLRGRFSAHAPCDGRFCSSGALRSPERLVGFRQESCWRRAGQNSLRRPGRGGIPRGVAAASPSSALGL